MSHNKDLQHAYLQYKASTKTVLSWLFSLSHRPPANPIPWFDIKQAAERIAAQHLTVPQSILSHLKSAIKGRKQVGELYQSRSMLSQDQHPDDIKHRIFINKLEEVLQILLPLQSRSSTTYRPHGSAPKDPTKNVPANRFSTLEVTENVEKPPGNFESPLHQSSVKDRSLKPQLAPPLFENFILEDDDLGEWIELSYFLCEVDAISYQVNEYWRKAAKGQLPAPLAAWLSTTAFHAVKRIFNSINHIAPTLESLLDKWIHHQQKGVKIRFKDIPQLAASIGGRCAEGAVLIHITQILNHCRTLEEYRVILPDAGSRQRPEELIPQYLPGEIHSRHENFNGEDLAFDKIQESMRQLLVSKRAIAKLELSDEDKDISEPLLSPLRLFLNDPELPVPFHLAYGMELLLSTYNAFLWQENEINKLNCRILALKFAKEVQKSLTDVVSILKGIPIVGNDPACLDCLILQEKLASLDEYIHEQRFDLYYQSPWVAGCHMVEILEFTFFEQAQLCCKHGYVCATLHMYNALRQLDPPIQKITLLEQLCQLFLEPLFLGATPKENFSSHFRRAMGQGLNRRNASQYDKPSGFARAPLVSRRTVDRANMSLFYQLVSARYQPTVEFWAQIYINPAPKQLSNSQARRISREVNSVPFSEPLEKIKTTVEKEFNGELPIMRTNLFSIFCFCTQLLYDISALVESDSGLHSTGAPSAASGFYLVDSILYEVVDHLGDERRHLLKYFRPLNTVRDIFGQLRRDLSLSEYQWSI